MSLKTTLTEIMRDISEKRDKRHRKKYYRCEFADTGIFVIDSHSRTLVGYKQNDVPQTVVRIPEGIKVIGEEVFCGGGAVSVVIPEGVREIKSRAFFNCADLTGVSFPSSLRAIGDRAFTRCAKLKRIDIPDGVASIGEETFAYCVGLVTASLPDRLSRLAPLLFYECKGLKAVNIPKSTRMIGCGAFRSCSRLKAAALPDGLEVIDSEAFMFCSELAELHLPESLRTVGQNAFSCCTALRELTLPRRSRRRRHGRSPTGIFGSEVFSGCSELSVVHIPQDAEQVNGTIFRNCGSLNTVYIGDVPIFSDKPIQTWEINSLFGAVREVSVRPGLREDLKAQLMFAKYVKTGDAEAAAYVAERVGLFYRRLFDEHLCGYIEKLLLLKPSAKLLAEMTDYALDAGLTDVFILLEKHKGENDAFEDPADRFGL